MGVYHMMHYSEHPSHMSPHPQFPLKLEGTIRRWLVDTGVGQHVVGRSHSTKQQLKSLAKSDPITLATANGLIEVDQTLELHVDELGFSIWAYVLLEPTRAERREAL